MMFPHLTRKPSGTAVQVFAQILFTIDAIGYCLAALICALRGHKWEFVGFYTRCIRCGRLKGGR